MVQSGREVYYRNMDLFMEMAQNVTRLKEPGMIRRNLHACLQGVALQWYVSKLSSPEHQALANMRGRLKLWKQHLYKRFWRPQSEAMTVFTSERYTVQDAQNRREPADYVLNVV